MDFSNEFIEYCDQIKLDNLTDMHNTASEITKKLNKYYYDTSQDGTSHLYIVGSVGRNTAVKGNSDLDIIFDLPNDVYKKFNGYQTNGQSALLQEVKNVLKERYPNTKMRGDGQVVVIEFSKYTVEVVPAFKQSDDSFKYPDTHDGGSWKYTDPLSEQKECSACDSESNGAYYDFCHIIRCWKNNIGFIFGGLLIDTLVYNHFLNENYYSTATYDDYLTILLNLFCYLKNLNKEQNYWYAVGSNQRVYNSDSGTFIDRASDAYVELNEAINNNCDIGKVLQNLFGTDLFTDSNSQLNEFSQYRYSNTEEFIEDSFAVDVRYALQIDCKVSQDGWRDFFLLDYLKQGKWLRPKKNLDFFIKSTNCPMPYSIYWKVRNTGVEAIRLNQIRGQIRKTNKSHHMEITSFYGPHYVECYLVKNNICVARCKIDVPINTV